MHRLAAWDDIDAGSYYVNTTAPIYLVRPPSSQSVNLFDLQPIRSTTTGYSGTQLLLFAI